ncbi:MAG TPA: T9SS type A sorting domain-containing protein, partial [Cytophagales bacterium]
VTDYAEITNLNLINAVTDKKVESLTGGEKINYGSLGTNKINIEAKTNPWTVGSVKFVLDGVTKVENAAPYAWAGDSPKDGGTDYHAFTLAPGAHHLVVTPYGGPNATGTVGKAYTVDFQVDNGGFVFNGAGRLGTGEPEPETAGAVLAVAPNPFTDRTTLTFTATEAGPARLEVYSPAGTRVGRLFDGPVEAGTPYRCTFEGGSLPAGLYVARLTTGHRVTHCKLLLGR